MDANDRTATCRPRACAYAGVRQNSNGKKTCDKTPMKKRCAIINSKAA